ncbi:polyadenylate-binding protein-interacting protein 2B [Anopheles marshallii]|uniref:polyadenylate-binding protein-interacting protein 2B n=1 Tax=Anopheles marshallii TaxID=1521116 RepID=UPI00237AB659|nr:polyadenylate-binding protein-interacting protein 2B [Anopheles marshallii]
MKMKMPDNNIGGSSSNSYTHITINAANVINRGGGGDADTARNTGVQYPHDPYDSDADSLSTPPNEESGTGPADDFAEYMWMENEDEFDMQELQRLEEEELMDQCIEAMMMDEMASAEIMASTTLVGNVPRESGLVNILSSLQLDKDQQQQQLIRQPKDVNVEKSTLNPLAAEFVPSFVQRTLVAPTSY